MARNSKVQTTKSKQVDEVDLDVFENVYGDWLRETMDQKQFTPSEIADMSSISLPAIYNITSVRSKNPQKATRIALEKALGEKFDDKHDGERNQTNEIEQPVYDGLGEFNNFDPYNDHLLPTCTGVYVFYDISDRPVYVGKVAKSGRTIKARVKEHRQAFWFKQPIVNNGAYIPIKDERLCNQVEKVLIKFPKNNAVLNKHHVSI